ncbi:MAG: hypothetical protein KJI69_04230 [Patescibacteria group bacterium]|nr:hypothetical protein [Patescibacteria group bacterium]
MTQTFFSGQRLIIILIGLAFLGLFLNGFLIESMLVKGFITALIIPAFLFSLYLVMKEYEKDYAEIK